MGFNAKDVCIWYYRGKCGHPVYVEFYNKIKGIKEPTSSIDTEYMPSEMKWYCTNCGRLLPLKYTSCPYCNAKNLSENNQTNGTYAKNGYNKCQKCGKLIWSVLSKCPYCGSTDIKNESDTSSVRISKI